MREKLKIPKSRLAIRATLNINGLYEDEKIVTIRQVATASEQAFDERWLLAVDESFQVVGQVQLLQTSNEHQGLKVKVYIRAFMFDFYSIKESLFQSAYTLWLKQTVYLSKRSHNSIGLL